MQDIVLIFQFILAVILTIVVLLQKSSSIGLGAYSGSNESVFGAKGPAGFLTKLTFGVGLLFVVNTIALGYMYNKSYSKSVIDTVDIQKIVPDAPTKIEMPKKDENAAPSAPVAPQAQ